MKQALAVATAAILVAAAGGARADVVSTFDDGVDGWSIISFNNLSTSDYTVIGTYTAGWSATGGNPGGQLTSTDPDGGDYMFAAPSAYLGNLSSATGLSYDIDRPADPVDYNTTDVMIVGANGERLLWEANPALAPGPTWTSVSLSFMPSANWLVDTVNGAQATAADFQAVLANVIGVYIRGEYAYGPDDTGLDNVRLAGVGASAVPEPSSLALMALGLGALLPSLRRTLRRGRG